MIAVGGLSEYAAGNRAKLIRFDKETGKQKEYGVRIGDLLRKGDTRANVMLMPGDVIILPYCRYVQDKIHLEIENGHVIRIEGGLDAMLMRDWLEEGKMF